MPADITFWDVLEVAVWCGFWSFALAVLLAAMEVVWAAITERDD